MNEKSELITESYTLGGQVKDLRIEVQSLKEAAEALEGNLAKKEDAWATERSELIEKLDSSNAYLLHNFGVTSLCTWRIFISPFFFSWEFRDTIKAFKFCGLFGMVCRSRNGVILTFSLAKTFLM